jgi:hypothetical protein
MTFERKRSVPIRAIAAVLAALAPSGAALAQYAPNQPQYQGQAQYQGDDQARRDYDARYGPGAYDQARTAHDQVVRDYDAQHGPGAYDRAYGAQAAASAPSPTDEQRAQADAQRAQAEAQRAEEACNSQKRTDQVLGGVLGGVGGALLGNSVAHGGGKTGGTIIGGVGGAAAGVGIASVAKHCPPAQQ